MVKVTKRNGTIVPFNSEKIRLAILKAFDEVDNGIYPYATVAASDISKNVENDLKAKNNVTIEEIQDRVEVALMTSERPDVAQAYIRYRYKRELARKGNSTDDSIMELISGKSEYWNAENSNKDSKLVTTQRDYLAGITSTDIARRFLLSSDVVKAHDEGILHVHDMDYMAQSALTNCCLINLEDMLQNGTVINGVMVEKQHRIVTAATVATQIITAVTSSQYGGATINLGHLAPFVRGSYEENYKEYKSIWLIPAIAKFFAKRKTRRDVKDAVQTFNYQCNSMSTTNGQAPFISVFMYLNEKTEYREELAMLIEEFFKQRIDGLKNKDGIKVTQAFPKLLYVLDETNRSPYKKYWDLTKLAAKCSTKRLVPDYISEKKMKELKDGNVYGCMGCRSFLTVKYDDKGFPKFWGRFNQGVVTLSLPDIALSSGGDMTKFWELFEERTELCHKALLQKHDRIKGTFSDVAPIMWQDGAIARLKSGEKIDKLLFDGYSTISLGYAGLYECVKYMTGESHISGEKGMEFGMKVMQALNDKCAQWKEAENMDYSVYGSPIESTTYKFAKCLKERFGVVEGITDKNYITNSYHCPVFEEIDAFTKLDVESKYQDLSPGGAISYIEMPNMSKNVSAVLEVIKHIGEHIMYAELNTKSDYCHVCKYDGEIEIVQDGDNYIWKCPKCGNTDQTKMSVARRTCGYIGTNFWNKGRTQEILERVLHLKDNDVEQNH